MTKNCSWKSILVWFYLEVSEFCRTFAVVIELERHIEILLLSNDCVIVPGLGGFMAHHVGARYDEANGVFLPPLRTLGFNPQLKLNDSLLAQSYVECYDMSYPEALRRIEDEVTELRQHLDNEGRYELNGLGVLRLNDDGRLEFEPCEAGILTPSLYGLSSFEMAPLMPRRKGQGRTRTVALPTDAGTNALLRQQLVGEDEEDEADGEQAITIRMSWVRNAVAIAAAVVAFFVMTIPVGNSVVQPDRLVSRTALSIVTRDTGAKVARIDRKAVGQAIAGHDSVSRRHVAEKATAATGPVKPEPPREGYTIVLASQVTRRNASDFVDRLHRAGVGDARVYVNNNIVRVVCGSYPSQGAAYAGMNSMRRSGLVDDAWVMKLKN